MATGGHSLATYLALGDEGDGSVSAVRQEAISVPVHAVRRAIAAH